MHDLTPFCIQKGKQIDFTTKTLIFQAISITKELIPNRNPENDQDPNIAPQKLDPMKSLLPKYSQKQIHSGCKSIPLCKRYTHSNY